MKLNLIAFSLMLLLACMPMISRLRRRGHGLAINVAEGTHDGNVAKRADAVQALRYVLVKFGSDVDHVAVTGVADIPIGICTDEAEAIEDPVNIALLGSGGGRTLKGVASAAIALGDFIVPSTVGKVRTLPATTGTYYIIGRALNATAADLDQVEFDSCLPIQRVVP